ncbi:hypothetical protein D3C72_1004920 [compost metagenome]
MPRHGQQARLAQLGQQQFALAGLGQRGIVALHAGGGEQFGDHGLVDVGHLAHVHRGQVEAEDGDGALECVDARLGQRHAVVGAQGIHHDLHIGGECLGVVVRRHVCHRVALGLVAGELLRGGGQPCVHADQCAAVRLVGTVVGMVRRGIGQRDQLGADIHHQRRHRQLRAQRVQFVEIPPHDQLRLLARGVLKRL